MFGSVGIVYLKYISCHWLFDKCLQSVYISGQSSVVGVCWAVFPFSCFLLISYLLFVVVCIKWQYAFFPFVWFLLPAGAVFGTIVRWDQKRNRKEER